MLSSQVMVYAQACHEIDGHDLGSVVHLPLTVDHMGAF
ncbi:hypothetical protein MSR1_04240 [Magnetospirillum gryphiswaldense MSR-1]|nr:hypothetical protein MSR1_04240 [Magnetospirillum gryphiswaldense MSR-1]AVM76839.1 hypothetical protein MSR1L_04240 [Magnetospirillum gryphiswaldense]